ncbi:eukaryotic translation initiation factor 2 alpha subunit, putative [Plasmodium relictum]|uniref:Eukaryotic translation initiation factor 2 subunit 1 n=1 Tax=Plasmodium relictum TaxID=85471 RepID=A0A1J1HGK7_PLARL|nr:eukaryotic translation initiation factor 2 alpha subunit, putative [Plasmodium relictum]CRH03138.1 eukaryotic translation initiation factor 2 alpha subunit, putative [Plasmodium relictum]
MAETRSKVDLGDCRFYEKKFPEVDDLIMVKVNRIEDMGAYVSILEYNDMEGMILMSELSKRRFRSVNKLIRVGRHEVVLVLRVDSQKGYIDLSKRRVSPKDIIKCEEKFSKSKKVHQTVRHVAQKHGITVEELNRRAIWPLYKKYGHALDALKEATMNPEAVFKGLDIDEEIKKSLLADIQLRLTPQALKLRGRIDVWCFSYEGIDAVKEALKKGKEISNEEVSINIKLIAPPQYVIVTSCHDKELGMSKIQEAMKVISDKIKEYKGGDFKQQGEILVIGGDEEKRLEELLDKHDELSSDEDDDNSSDEDEENSSNEEDNSSDEGEDEED